MSIKKFTTFEEASKDLWVMKPNKEYYERLKELFTFWDKLSQRKCKKGIQKFNSYEDLLKIQNGT
jgi:hypothetical protein